MTNMQRLEMEIRDISIEDSEKEVYLMENDLTYTDTYDPKSNTNKKAIYKTAVSILESIANSPKTMKNYKTNDITITHFHTNLLNQIDLLNKKIRTMVNDDLTSENDATFAWMYK